MWWSSLVPHQQVFLILLNFISNFTNQTDADVDQSENMPAAKSWAVRSSRLFKSNQKY